MNSWLRIRTIANSEGTIEFGPYPYDRRGVIRILVAWCKNTSSLFKREKIYQYLNLTCINDTSRLSDIIHGFCCSYASVTIMIKLGKVCTYSKIENPNKNGLKNERVKVKAKVVLNIAQVFLRKKHCYDLNRLFKVICSYIEIIFFINQNDLY